jgi:hypothetical protein
MLRLLIVFQNVLKGNLCIHILNHYKKGLITNCESQVFSSSICFQVLHFWDYSKTINHSILSMLEQTSLILKPTFAGESNSYICSGSEDSNIFVRETENSEVKQVLKGDYHGQIAMECFCQQENAK